MQNNKKNIIVFVLQYFAIYRLGYTYSKSVMKTPGLIYETCSKLLINARE